MQYRFGTSYQTPDLVYPAEKVHPTSKFSYGYTGAAKSSLYNLHFTLSGYSYTIYIESAAFDENGAGIKVKTRAGKSSRLRCKETSPLADFDLLPDLGLRQLPEESLVSLGSFETWPAESPNADLLQGVRTHNFALVKSALAKGADVNFHSPDDVGVLAALADSRSEAVRLKRTAEFDKETDKLLALLLAHGASPTISMTNGNTAMDALVNKVPLRTIRTLLDAGWPADYHYRLYVGAMLGNPAFVKEVLDHGADPNKPTHGGRHILPAITRACDLSYKGEEGEQKQALAALELLLKAGAKMDEGDPRNGGGDIVQVYSGWGHQPNIIPLLDLLVRYASPAARANSLHWVRIGYAGTSPKRKANLDWLIKRLSQ